MASNRARIICFLLAYVIFSMGVTEENGIGAMACPQYCLDVEYMTCKSSGEEKLSPKCNCCLAPKQCTLHLADGTSVDCN